MIEEQGGKERRARRNQNRIGIEKAVCVTSRFGYVELGIESHHICHTSRAHAMLTTQRMRPMFRVLCGLARVVAMYIQKFSSDLKASAEAQGRNCYVVQFREVKHE